MSRQRPEEAYSEEEFRRIMDAAARDGAAPEAEGGAGAGDGYPQGGRGHLRAAGDWVEWRDPSGRAYLGVVREEGRTRFRAIADQAPDLVVGATATGFLGLLLMAVAPSAGRLARPGAGRRRLTGHRGRVGRGGVKRGGGPSGRRWRPLPVSSYRTGAAAAAGFPDAQHARSECLHEDRSSPWVPNPSLSLRHRPT